MTANSEIPLQASPFADDFVDVAALNARISTHLLDRIESVRRAALAGEVVPSKAIAVLGPAGGGKTHLFSRLRHVDGPRPTLILLRPYFGVSITLRDVLAVVIDQLCLPVHGGGRTQLEVVATHWHAAHESLEGAVGAVVSLLPEIAPAAHLARALLELSERAPSEAWADLAWLSGREPRTTADGVALAPLGEHDVLHVLRIVAVLAAPVAPVVLTFDQLENLAGDDDARVLGYGNLVSEIVDSLPCFTVVQLALTSEWMQSIEPRLSLPQKTRMAHDTFVLDGPDREQREQLLRMWYEQLAGRTPGRRKKRFPGPLSDEDLGHLLSAPGMTPRLLLAALSRAVSGEPLGLALEPASGPAEVARAGDAANGVGPRVLPLWRAEHARVIRELEDKERSELPVDAGELAEALNAALSFVPQVEVTSRTERDRIFTRVKAPGHELEMTYLTSLHHIGVAAALSRAAETAKTTKVVIVREKRFEFPAAWETVNERRAAFERLPNARWLWVERDDLARCLNLARLLSKARAQRLELAGSGMLSLAEARAALATAQAPDQWSSVAAITRWLSDVPMDRPAVGARVAVPAPVSAPAPASASAPAPAPASAPAPLSAPASTPAPASAPAPSTPPAPPTLRAWLSLGREVGRSAVSRYVEKVRTFVRRGG